MMFIIHKQFGKTKRCKVSLHNMTENDTPDEVLWVERPEDYYALMSPQLRNKKVAILDRNDWLRGTEIKE